MSEKKETTKNELQIVEKNALGASMVIYGAGKFVDEDNKEHEFDAGIKFKGLLKSKYDVKLTPLDAYFVLCSLRQHEDLIIQLAKEQQGRICLL